MVKFSLSFYDAPPSNLFYIVSKLKNIKDNHVHKGEWKVLNDVEMKKISGLISLIGVDKSKNRNVLQ